MSCSPNNLRLVALTKELTSHVNQGLHEKALALFHHMQTTLALPLDAVVFPLALKSCAALPRPWLGSSIHSHATKAGLLSNPFVASALVDMYGKCGSVASAGKVFDEIPQRNAVVWNAMISVYSRCGRVDDALGVFRAMDVAPSTSTFNTMITAFTGVEDGPAKAIMLYREMWKWGLKPNLISLLALLPACVGLAALGLVKEIHGYAIRNGIDPNYQLRSGLVEAYGRAGYLASASCVFKSMKEKDVVAWSSLISVYAFHGDARTALEYFREMELAHVRPDDICFLAVLKACSHAGLADEALHYFNRIPKEYALKPSSDHYSCLIDVLSRAGRLYDAYNIISKMPVKATAKAWGALLGACQTYGEVELAEIAGKALLEMEPENHGNYISLGRIYASVGKYEEAQRLRMEMEERRVKIAAGTSWLA